MKILSIRIAQLRKEHGLTIAQLAKEINVCPSTVSNWEKGKSTPKTLKIILLANYFNKKIDFLLGRIN